MKIKFLLLILQINEIKQELNQIVEAIDRDLYDTKTNCCPTFLRVIVITFSNFTTPKINNFLNKLLLLLLTK